MNINRGLAGLMVVFCFLVMAALMNSCGSGGGTESVVTTTTLAPSSISGVVQVPATALTGFGVVFAQGVKASATADDGVSNSYPPAGTLIGAYDPITEQRLTDISTATVSSSDGSYTLDTTLASANGTLPEGELLLKAKYTSGGKTLLVQGVASPGATANITAGSAMAWNKIKEELAKKTGDLLTKATTLPATRRTQLRQMMRSLYDTIPGIVGTISSDNIPDLTLTSTGKTDKQLEKEMFEAMSRKFQTEYDASTASDYKTNYTNYLTDFYTNASSLCVGATYPGSLEIDGDYSGFVMPSGFPFPSGVQFQAFRDTGFFSDVLSDLPNISGAQFMSGCTLPAYVNDYIPSGALIDGGVRFADGFIFNDYMNNVVFDSDFEFNSDIQARLASDFRFGDNAEGVQFGTDFIFNSDVSGLIGSDFSFRSGAANAQFSDWTFKTDMVMGSGFVVPSGVNFETGFTVPSGVDMASGFVLPHNIGFDSGFVMPTDVVVPSGYNMPTDIGFESGFVMPRNVVMPSGFVIPSGVEFESGFLMPRGVEFGSGFVPPSDMQYESGFHQPSGWTPPSDWVPPSDWD